MRPAEVFPVFLYLYVRLISRCKKKTCNVSTKSISEYLKLFWGSDDDRVCYRDAGVGKPGKPLGLPKFDRILHQIYEDFFISIAKKQELQKCGLT